MDEDGFNVDLRLWIPDVQVTAETTYGTSAYLVRLKALVTKTIYNATTHSDTDSN